MRTLWDRIRGVRGSERVVLSAEQRASIYLDSSLWDRLLVPQSDGLPPLKLTRHDGALWLAERQTGKLVNVGNRRLRQLGVWSAKIRGAEHHLAEWKKSSVNAGAPVTLVREPGNTFDSNAVAVHGSPDFGVLGYVNKQMAAPLAKAIDSGEELVALCLGVRPFKVIAARPDVISWIQHR